MRDGDGVAGSEWQGLNDQNLQGPDTASAVVCWLRKMGRSRTEFPVLFAVDEICQQAADPVSSSMPCSTMPLIKDAFGLLFKT